MKTSSKIQNSHLLDISEINPFSKDNPKDVQCFDEIRQVLKKYNYLDRFGVCLLHRHFDVFSDECLIESCDISTRTLTIEPIKQNNIISKGQLIETSWNLSPKKPIPEVSCETYCWVDSKGEHQWSHKKE